MTPENIVSLCHERPFKAFTLHFSDGSIVRVKSQDMILAYDSDWTARVLILETGQIDLVDLNHVVRVSIDA